MDNLAQPMTILMLLVTGIGVALLGSIKLSLARKLQIDEARIGALVSAFGFTIIPMILLSGFLTDSIGQKAVLVAGSLIMTAGLFLLAASPTYTAALVAVLLLGTSWSALVNSVNSFVPAAFGGSMLYATNLANVFFGLGAFLTPIGLAFLLRKKPVGTVLSGLGLAVLIPAALAWIVDFSFITGGPGGAQAPPPDQAGFLWVLQDPVLWILALGMFFYAPLEASLGAWSTSYLGELGVSEASALRWLSAFWLSFMLARLATALILPSGSEKPLLLVGAVACVAILLWMVVSSSQSGGIFAVVAAGLIFGPIFPTLLALLLDHFALEVRGRAVGLFFAIGAVGWTIIPAMIGSQARKTTVQKGFRVAVGSALGFLAIAMVILFRF